MTKTNAKTATQAADAAAKAPSMASRRKAAAKVQINDPHALTEEAKARKAASAKANAKNPKASNQTAVAEPAKRGKRVLGAEDFPGETEKQMAKRLNRELEQEAKAEGTVRAYDQITVSGPHPQSAGYHMIGSSTNNAITVPSHKMVGALAEGAKLGASFKAFKAAWEEVKRTSTGKLAAGLDGRNAPHSAKSAADHNAAARGTNKADKVQSRKATETAKKAERKAAAQAKAAPKADDNRKITVLDKKFSYGRPESNRNVAWLACKGSKTVAEYAAKGGALKYLPRWVSAGAIKLG